MSAPVTTQLRDYFAFVDEQQGAVDVDTLGARSEQLVSSVRPAVAVPRRRAWVAALVAAAVVVMVVLAVVFSAGGQPDVATTLPTVSTTSLPASSTTLPATTTSIPTVTTTTTSPTTTTTSSLSSQPANPEITHIIDAPHGSTRLVGDGDSLLVVTATSGISGKLEVTRLDAASGEVIDTIPEYSLSGGLGGLQPTLVDDALWISFRAADAGASSLLRFDLTARAVTDRIPTSSQVFAPVVFADGGLWAFQSTGQLLRINPESAEVTDRINPPPGDFTLWAEVVDNTIWAFDTGVGLYSFDPSTAEFSTRAAPQELDPSEFEGWVGYVDRDVVWLVSEQGQIERFDTTQGITTLESTLASDVGFGVIWEGGIWLPSRAGVLYQIHLGSGEVTVHNLEIGTNPGQPVVANGSLWLPRWDDNTIVRIDSIGP